MTRRRYSSAASQTALTNSIDNSQTAILVNAVTGFPGSFPYELIIDPGTASEECVLVTGGTGTSLTVTRGFDGTTGLAHAAGATVVHGVSAIDFDEANAHVNETTTAHGLTLANIPRGTLGYAQVTADQAGIAATVDTAVSGLSSTVTVAAGRRIRVSTSLQTACFTAINSVSVRIKQDGVMVMQRSSLGDLAATAIDAEVVLTPSAGSHTYTVTVFRASGGTLSVIAASDRPAWILVEDIGV